MNEATRILHNVIAGDRSGVDRLTELVYTDLRRRAEYCLADEKPQTVLQPTALVHETFLRMIDQKHVSWQGRSHFLAVSATMMRRIIVDEARKRRRLKRGGNQRRVEFDEDVTLALDEDEHILALHSALQRLENLNPDHARIVEMRFFAGMTVDEVATALDQPKRSVERLWTGIKAWLRREIADDGTSDGESKS